MGKTLCYLRYPLLLLYGMLCLLSCDSDTGSLYPDNELSGREIIFDIGFAGGDDTPQTKVGTNTDLRCYWQIDDEVGLYIVKGNGELQPNGNYADNIKLTYKGFASGWVASDVLYYPNDGDNLHFYAYYPYDADMDNPLDYSFSVRTSQDISASDKDDFLWSKTENVTKSKNPVGMQFSHALTLIELAIRPCESSVMDLPVLLNNVDIGCSINLAAQRITGKPGKSDITFTADYIIDEGNHINYFYFILLPPQTTELRFNWTYNNTTYMAEFPSVALTGGKVARYKIDM